MPEEFDLDSDDAQVLDPNIRREMRESRNRARELEQQLANAKREAAFAKAGVDDSTPLGRMFVRGYEGDISVDAIKAEALEIPGLIAPPAGSSTGMSAEEIETQKRMAGASGGEGTGGPNLRSQFEADAADLERRIRAGQAGPEEVMELVRNADPSLGIVQRGMQ